MYINHQELRHADADVFVNIFSSGKCTITAAASMEVAHEVRPLIALSLIASNPCRPYRWVRRRRTLPLLCASTLPLQSGEGERCPFSACHDAVLPVKARGAARNS